MSTASPISSSPITDRRPWGLLVAAVFALGAYAALYSLGNIRTHLPRYFALVAMGAGLMLLAHRAWDILAGDNERRAVNIVIASAIVFRLALLGLEPSLSDDLYRYAWDGHVLANGHNPYAYTPNDAVLRGLRNEAYDHIAYKDYHSIYPPVVELGLGAAAWLSEAIFGGSMRATMMLWKLMLCGAEWVSIVLIARLLALWNMPARRLVLYAWHPLAIIEFAGQGHGDALMIAPMLWCLWAIARAKRTTGMIGYAAGVAARAVPLMFAPLLARSMGWKRVLPALVIAAMLAAPFIGDAAVQGVLDSVQRMGSVFVFNAFGFWAVYGVLEAVHAWTLEPYITPALAAVFVTGLAVLSRHRGSIAPRDMPRAMLAVCTLFALVAWNMHPWYFTWGLSLVPFTVSRAWLWLTLVSEATYVHYTPRSDAALLVSGVVEYGGFVVLLILQRRFAVARETGRA